MKKLIACIIAFSCGASLGAAPGMIVVEGAASNSVVYNSDRGQGQQTFRPETATSAAIFEIPDKECGDLLYLIHDEKASWVRVLPGETVNVDVGRTPWYFSGDQAAVNAYLYNWTQKMYHDRPNMLASNVRMMMVELPDDRTLSDPAPLHEPGYAEWMYGLKDECLRDLDGAALGDDAFVVAQRSRICHAWLEMMVSNYCISKMIGDPIAIPQPITGMILSDASLIEYPGLDYIFSYYITVCEDAGLIGYDSYAGFLCRRAERITDTVLRTNYLLKEAETLIRRQQNFYQADRILDNVSEMIDDSGLMFLQDLRDFYTGAKKTGKLHEGMPGFAFELEDRDGKPICKDDFRGKYLYIDVWATWCGPCKEQIPHLMKLEKEFADKDIEFISISVDKPRDRAKWVAMLDELGLHGNQAITLDGFDYEMCKHYEIKGIPRFILYGPDGTVVMANARRPSDPLLKVQLDELLNY